MMDVIRLDAFDLTGVVPQVLAFRDAREWKQFHTPRNLAASVAIEAAELLELYQWDASAEPQRVAEELADVLIYAVTLAHDCGIDIAAAIHQKLRANAQRYPIARARGSSEKASR